MTKSNVSDSTSFTRNSEVKFEDFAIDDNKAIYSDPKGNIREILH